VAGRKEEREGMCEVRQTGHASSATQNSWKACPHSKTTIDDERPTLSASGSVQHSHEPRKATAAL
jgi:hypothetical protein